jgi:glycosyltransferase involved in cell wall biosynthesis
LKVALTHDYLTQRGGAERVVASLQKAFPDAPLYTSLYDPERTFPEFQASDVRTLTLDRVALLRRHHRLALPFLASSFSQLDIDADVAICSSSGWAHGAHVRGRKIVYCHAPARWLYQRSRYLGERPPLAARTVLSALHKRLLRSDRLAAASAHRYLTNSRAVREQIRSVYGIHAEVVAPPHTLDPRGPQRAVAGLDAGFTLTVSRLLPYKNVGAVIEAFTQLRDERLVVAGSGPDEERLRRAAPRNVTLAGGVDDDELRWLYANSRGLVAASYEDYGLTPLEAAAFGRPSAALEFGGYLDTVTPAIGVFFDKPEPREIRAAVERLHATPWNEEAIRSHAASFSEERFVARMRTIAAEEASAA